MGAKTGQALRGCSEASKHVHGRGMIADLIAKYPGQECYADELRLYTTAIPATSRHPCPMQDRLYPTDVAAVSMGYFSPPQLSRPLTD